MQNGTTELQFESGLLLYKIKKFTEFKKKIHQRIHIK